MPRRVLVLALVLACAALAAAADSPPLSKELKLRIERVVRAYATAPPEAQVTLGALKASDTAGFDELQVTLTGGDSDKTFNFLLSHDRKRLLYVRSFDLTEDPYARIMRAIQLAGRPARGPEKAPVTLVLYDDFQCPFCARMYITLFNEVMNRYRDRVRVVLKDFPIADAHPWATDAAVAANCLLAQKQEAFWKFSDYVHTHQQAMTGEWNAAHDAFGRRAELDAQQSGADATAVRACVARHDTSAIDQSKAEGEALGVSSTPGLFINGEFYEGELTAGQLRTALDRALKEAGR